MSLKGMRDEGRSAGNRSHKREELQEEREDDK